MSQLSRSGPDLEYLRAECIGLVRSTHASNTIENYGYQWGVFERWCEANRCAALPASPETVRLHLTDLLLLQKRKTNTAIQRAAAISHMHRANDLPNPVDKEAWKVIKGAQRIRGEQPQQKAAVTIPELRKICAGLGKQSEARRIRNKAIILVGFASALRRCNIVALDLSDLKLKQQGFELRVGKEKQDQNGKGRKVGIPYGKHSETCPVAALQAWLEVRGLEPGPLFTHIGSLQRLRGNMIATIVQQAVQEIGRDAKLYGAHSLRAGFVTAAGEANVNHLLIMAQTGHRSVQSLLRYFRRQDPFKANACAALDL